MKMRFWSSHLTNCSNGPESFASWPLSSKGVRQHKGPPHMFPEYLALAEERRSTRCAPHGQPEDFGYDFANWVSPYTKGAHAIGGVMLVLQDWASKEGLCHTYHPQVQLLGRMPQLLTNRRLEVLLQRVLGLSLGD